MHRAAWVGIAAVLGCAASLAATRRADGPSFTVAPALVKVRPGEPLPAIARGSRVDLVAARGECEGAHLVASSGARALRGLEVEAAPLAGAKGAKAVAVALYREAFIDVKTPSNTEGASGEWPDPLVPVVDAIAGEKRRAFPVDVPAKRHQPIFVEVCVPRDASPGRYTGALSVRAEGVRASVPVALEVLPVELPATSSMPVTFGLSGKSLLFGHYGRKRSDELRLELVNRYAKAALRHRISLHTMSMLPPRIRFEGEKLEVDFERWDAEIAPFLDGTALPDGARFTAIDLRTPEHLKGAPLRAYYREVAKHFREKGWLDRLFAYVMDEPGPERDPELLPRLDALEGTGIRRLVTTSVRGPLVGKVDIWTPNLNCMAFKKDPTEYCHTFAGRDAYRAREKGGDRLWWYQSCSSHGCRSGPFGKHELDAYFSGWPSYMVDADGASARVMGWLAYAQDVGGELYFDMTYAYNLYDESKPETVDPWDSVWAFGGNGDGTLFYPGRPDRIGGETHVPVESLRLKLIRDGLEDYELLRLLASRGEAGERQARALAASLASRPYRFEHDPEAWAATRARLVQALAEDAGPVQGRAR